MTGIKNIKSQKKLLIPVILLFFSLLLQAQGERKVAVFDPAGTVDNALLEIVREEISSVVVSIKGYTVLERQLINKVLEENRFQESGLVSDTQVSDIGKRMGADFVFVSTISKLGDNYYISCKMIEVATARIDKQFTGTTTDGMNDIPQTTQFIVRRLFGENVTQTVVKRTTPVQQQASETANRATNANATNTTGRSPSTNNAPSGYIASTPTGSVEDDLVLLVMLKTKKVFNNNYKKGSVIWVDPTSAQWYINQKLARPYYSSGERLPNRPVNHKVLVEFTSDREIKHHLGQTIFRKGDLVWFNDDIGEYYVRKKVALYRRF